MFNGLRRHRAKKGWRPVLVTKPIGEFEATVCYDALSGLIIGMDQTVGVEVVETFKAVTQ